jgi:hypothetical protein
VCALEAIKIVFQSVNISIYPSNSGSILVFGKSGDSEIIMRYLYDRNATEITNFVAGLRSMWERTLENPKTMQSLFVKKPTKLAMRELRAMYAGASIPWGE